MFDIQRLPLGLSNVLSIYGPGTPAQLSPQLFAVLDALQFYGLSQRTVVTANNAALAENAGVDVVTTTWALLLSSTFSIAKTATITALRGGISIGRSGAGSPLSPYKSEELGPFGATESGVVNVCFMPPTPMILPPGTIIRGQLQILGTDATANCTIAAELGVLG